MPIRFASETWPRPGLAEPHQHTERERYCRDQDKQVYKGLVLGPFLGSETDMIFGDGVGASLVTSPDPS